MKNKTHRLLIVTIFSICFITAAVLTAIFLRRKALDRSPPINPVPEFSYEEIPPVTYEETPPVVYAEQDFADADGNNSYGLKNIKMDRRYPLFPDEGENSPFLTISFNILDSADMKIQRLIYQVLYDGKDMLRYSEDFLNGTSKDYLEIHEDIKDNPEWSHSALNNWNSTITHVAYMYDDFFTIRKHLYEYTGGAHGNYWVKFYNIDTEKMELVTLGDIIEVNSTSQLREILYEAALIEANEYTEWFPLEGFKIPEEAFRLKPEGLTFYFQTYEIASYVRGIVEVVLPYDDIASLLSDRGRELAERVK
jgi:hypothetical protein